ncbi:Asp-tRNA(Asn)/Glu-tRNA(Gln) amidotransferase GatCAB subunit B [Candidatus Wolfebacteria bacterium CG18_big_fil_WC_8_21_14_2_50_39_7]|uniref:Aspartyl/glutamyl-tRNA(Asn/Gln) amidotransferase subunit B n=3 Tax=Candidatus Wolfeibacteriota TaxID=1752735 RepID=A0A2H0ECV6_9BACT|nr:Asp-tRNA(Asn)/Glu-tRNA(Gln) amidotransferase subunit GatB [Parcubacteria group bacterium]OIO65126.1 MAG: glutaminyl-tRNA synthase (glutamine-hydrolyzing) subunit B [Candidatus Wolfebacteria bacterium CG1_02_39_135]PIP92283.1 MAG: Asp-tRNA(Asn)/Glu-tRNA(Gln) amidotransferase GatCAB subunit B [Candidatus Wolfebacteria bacterium CG18_big_fil_WC_8_21_14_2_50_39_7]
MTNYSPTIGLEIHIELKTKTKMFCGCLNDADEKHPNINVCPICLAHPGVLPVINKKAVESVLKLGLALNSKIPEISKFDRKNYFYPDLPKGYQISQYDKPLVVGGKLNGVKITRIHLEEDTGRLTHSHRQKSSYSLVDFNRAGIPLMELVTEPDIKSGEEAVKFAKELQLILRYLEISDADMEKGQMRVEVNISISDKRQGTSDKELGTKVEIKNLNSFRAVEESIDYEIKRQPEILDKGEEIKQETRGWDDIKKRTVSQRLKEESHDYRYFPEPDLPPLDLTKFNLEELKVSIPELPAQKRARFIKEYGLLANQTEILIEDRGLAQYFEESASELRTKLPIPDYQLLFNYFSSDTRGLMNEQKITVRELNITPENFADLIVLLSKGEISSRSAKDILKEMFLTGLDPRQIIRDKGLTKLSDNTIIEQIVGETIKENPKAVEDYKKGKENALQFLIGQAMAKSKGRGNPEIFRKLFKDKF